MTEYRPYITKWNKLDGQGFANINVDSNFDTSKGWNEVSLRYKRQKATPYYHQTDDLLTLDTFAPSAAASESPRSSASMRPPRLLIFSAEMRICSISLCD